MKATGIVRRIYATDEEEENFLRKQHKLQDVSAMEFAEKLRMYQSKAVYKSSQGRYNIKNIVSTGDKNAIIKGSNSRFFICF